MGHHLEDFIISVEYPSGYMEETTIQRGQTIVGSIKSTELINGDGFPVGESYYLRSPAPIGYEFELNLPEGTSGPLTIAITDSIDYEYNHVTATVNIPVVPDYVAPEPFLQVIDTPIAFLEPGEHVTTRYSHLMPNTQYYLGVYRQAMESNSLELETYTVLQSNNTGMVSYEYTVQETTYFVLVLNAQATEVEEAGYIRTVIVR
jgi:hypothetical protein